MILQSHNSWSYIRPKKWWLRPFSFIARCQSVSIYHQYYDYGVRSFDLRVRFDKEGRLVVAHGCFQFDIDYDELMKHLSFLDEKRCVVRVVHEARTRGQYTDDSANTFIDFCSHIQSKFPNIKFYCGRNLYNWGVDYKFDYHPSEDERYSSVRKPKIIDDWFPWIYAKLNNKKILKDGTDKDILSIDFVNIR